MTGADILNKAAQHVNEKYVFGARVPKNNPNWHGPWDCAEFASWCVFQISNKLYGCDDDNGNPASADAYTGYWKRDAQTLGQTISIQQAAVTAGAAVLRFPAPGANGHIVFSDGAGGTIEAHSTVSGVIRAQLGGRRWDTGILVPGITYSQNAQPVPVPQPQSIVYHLASPSMEGEAVKRIQSALGAKGFDPGIIDGVYGPHTMAAVTAFQIDNGLVPDGEVGPKTAAALGVTLS